MFKASPFLVGDDCVSIMNGTDEGRVSRSPLCDEAVLGNGPCAGLLLVQVGAFSSVRRGQARTTVTVPFHSQRNCLRGSLGGLY